MGSLDRFKGPLRAPADVGGGGGQHVDSAAEATPEVEPAPAVSDPPEAPAAAAPEIQHTNDSAEAHAPAEKVTLYLDSAGEMAYWKDGKVHVLDTAGKAERARQEREPNSPPAPGFPKFGGVDLVTSFDEIQAREAQITESSPQPQGPANAAPGTAGQPERPAAAGGGAGNVPPQGPGNAPAGAPQNPEAKKTSGLDWKYYFGVSGVPTWQTFDPSQYADIIPKSIDQIIQNPQYQQGFGELIMAINPDKSAILDKIRRKEKLDPNDDKFISFVQHEFTRNTLAYEKIEKDLTKEKFEELVAVHPKMRLLVDRYGSSTAALAEYKKLMYRTAMTSKGSFEQVQKGFARWNHSMQSERAQKAQRRALEISKRMNIPRRNFEMMFGIGTEGIKDWGAISGRVREHMLQQAENMKGAVNWVDQLSAWKSGHLLSWQARWSMPTHWNLLRPRSWKTSALYGARTDIADAMSFITQDLTPQFRPEMEYSVFTNTPMPAAPVEAGPKNFKEVQTIAAKREYSDAELDGALTNAITRDYGSVDNFNALPDRKRNEAWDKIEKNLNRDDTEGLGYFALFLRWLFKSRLNESSKRVLKQPSSSYAYA